MAHPCITELRNTYNRKFLSSRARRVQSRDEFQPNSDEDVKLRSWAEVTGATARGHRRYPRGKERSVLPLHTASDKASSVTRLELRMPADGELGN